MNENGLDDLIRAKLEFLDAADAATTDAPGVPIIDAVKNRVMMSCQRSGYLNGRFCVVVETTWHAFRLLGFLDGRWRVEGRRIEHDLRADCRPKETAGPEASYELVPATDIDIDGVSAHVIVGMHTQEQADALFSTSDNLSWTAVPIDGNGCAMTQGVLR